MQRWTSQQVRAYVAQAINSSSWSNACEAFTGVDVWIDSARLHHRPDVLSHDEPLVEFFWREEAGWLLTRIDIEAIGVKLPMRDVYRGVEFPAASE